MRIGFICLIINLALGIYVPAAAQAGPEYQRSIRLLFVGDIMGHDSQIAAAQVEKDKLYDYSSCFQLISPILQQADLAIGNLELTLPGKPPYKGYPRFRSPDELAMDLRHAGFDGFVKSQSFDFCSL